MTLQQKLDDFKSRFESSGPRYKVPNEIFHRATEGLRQPGLAETRSEKRRSGASIHPNNQYGKSISSAELLAKGPPKVES